MVKSYDRYEFEDCFGIVNSKSSNCVFLNYNNILSGHDECVSIWNINEKEIKKKLTVPFTPPYYFFTYHVTYICINEKNKNILAVGYINGSIRLFDIEKNKILSTFHGHTSSICKLKFNKNGNFLCSCSKDTNIILWDVINDKGVFKLEGHTNAVTDIEFLKIKNDYLDDFISNNLLISVSKDCLIKVWELNIQSCVQTLVDCEEEISCLLINESNTRLIIGCNSFLRIYKIDLYSNIKDKFTNCKIYISFLSTIKRPNNCRIQNMKMIFFIENDINFEEEENLHLTLKDDNNVGENDLNINGVNTNINDNNGGIKEDKNIINVLNNSLNNSLKICERTTYCFEGDNNGILVCCTNLKKIEFYKINSIKNQKKSEKAKKKRYIEKLKKKKKMIIKEQKRIEKFKGKNNIDYINLTYKLEEIEQEISIYNRYDIHTANDEIKYLFNYNCKFRLQNIDIYKKRKKDIFVYLLISFATNRLSIFEINLYDILNNKDMFIVKGEGKSKNSSNQIKEEESENKEKNEKEDKEKNSESEDEEEKNEKEDKEKYSESEDEEEKNEKEDKEKYSESEDEEEKKENEGKVEKSLKIIEKKIYDYSKCFKEICEINKGHNSSVNYLNLSENGELMVSICKRYVKIWNMKTFQNIITINSEGCTSAFFCHNDEYLVISDEYGYIFLYELKNIELKYIYKAHTNKIINLCKKSKSNSFLSVGEENYLKIFELTSSKEAIEHEESDEENKELREVANKKNSRSNDKKEINKINENEETVNQKDNFFLRFTEMDCYNLTDKVSCAIYSPNEEYISIGYLNNLIEVLYSDTLKLHLTLYGHSLPITCIDISKDNKLLASSSSDKFLFIWNLEYGSINKRLHINCDVLTKIQFFNESNNLISISRDGYIKMWDAVKFECICTIDGSFGILTSLVINYNDDFFLTSGTHKSIRYWKRGDDLIFLEEERDKELNLQIEKEAVRNDLAYPSSVEKNVLLNKATIKTIETIKSSEKLIEYLDIIDEELTLLDVYYKNLTAYQEAKKKNELPDFVQPPTKPNSRPELLNKDPYEFIIEIVCNIKNNILNEVLISLPFSYAYKLLDYIKTYLKSFYFFQKIQDNRKKFRSCGDFNFYVEYSINIVLNIINIYRNQFLFDTKFRFLLYELHELIIPHLRNSVEQCSFNQTTLNFLINSIEDDNLNLNDYDQEFLHTKKELRNKDKINTKIKNEKNVECLKTPGTNENEKEEFRNNKKKGNYEKINKDKNKNYDIIENNDVENNENKKNDKDMVNNKSGKSGKKKRKEEINGITTKKKGTEKYDKKKKKICKI
ncbi:U3 snoRNA-associated small subunit rRNA processing protein, putative [Plasmodium relictum]|uniref:U3 snoRNA-associated small subunit rRNA processing protein, putative n=1 Tax=Plasmodium relictum TaxID=85471 RepID=A0A1J1H9Y7_PLARL|nr:U3 snoRNA-associated small subunit rRNA processing protein, putative [Plasmodium relictum]CRH01446.1 U3 snoRNA-associated small subunit rRNA processing protein, putative [Plasmodium relictum]